MARQANHTTIQCCCSRPHFVVRTDNVRFGRELCGRNRGRVVGNNKFLVRSDWELWYVPTESGRKHVTDGLTPLSLRLVAAERTTIFVHAGAIGDCQNKSAHLSDDVFCITSRRNARPTMAKYHRLWRPPENANGQYSNRPTVGAHHQPLHLA